tara:strand:- start:663 stop:1319 length:657 start_codon:yes stop_codon:yes gene_type:complete
MIKELKESSIKIFWKENLIELFPSRSLFIHQTKELLISDVHIGKGDYFQLNGIPLTNNNDNSNFQRISDLIKKIKPKKLIILGDLFHSKFSLNDDLINKIEQLSKTLDNKIELIEGNHDKGCYVKDILYLKSKKSLDFIFSHEPILNKHKELLNICGHYHPKLILKNRQDKISLRCFAMDNKNNVLYLPAFGDLTGGFECKKEFKKWPIISDNHIIEL